MQKQENESEHMSERGDDVFAAKMQEDFAELANLQESRTDKIVTFVRDKPFFSLAISLLTGGFVSWLLSSKKK